MHHLCVRMDYLRSNKQVKCINLTQHVPSYSPEDAITGYPLLEAVVSWLKIVIPIPMIGIV